MEIENSVAVCALCSSDAVECTEKNLESFKTSAKKLWDIWEATFTHNQEQLFEAGAFSTLQICSECNQAIVEAFELKLKLAALKEKIAGNISKSLEELDSTWACKQFRTEVNTIIKLSEQDGMSDGLEVNVNEEDFQDRGRNVDKVEKAGGSSPSSAANEDNWMDFEPPEVQLVESAEKLNLQDSDKVEVKQKPVKKPKKRESADLEETLKEVEAFPCDACIEQAPTAVLWGVHRAEVHEEADPGSLMYICEVCAKNLAASELVVKAPVTTEAEPESTGDAASKTETKYRLTTETETKDFSSFYSLCRAHYDACKPTGTTTEILRAAAPKKKRQRRVKKEKNDSTSDKDDEADQGATDEGVLADGVEQLDGVPRSTKRTHRLYQCFFCGEHFCSGLTLDLHVRELHDEEPYTNASLKFNCCYCNKTWSKKDYDPTKGPKTKGYIPYNKMTKKCHANTFSTICDLHLRGCKGVWFMKPPLSHIQMECRKCHGKFALDTEFIMHLRSHYTSSHSVACPLCPHTASNRKYFGAHLSREHNLRRTGNDQYYCGQCFNYYMPINPNVESGRLTHEEIDNFKEFASAHADCKKNPKSKLVMMQCKFCSETFGNPEALFRHEVQKHTQNFTAAICEECGNSYPTEQLLTLHKRIHDRKFSCDICQKRFPSATRLKQHVRTHTGDRCYICPQCGAGFYTSAHLNRHIATHSTVAECPCPECGKLFKNKYDVRNHVYQVHQKARK